MPDTVTISLGKPITAVNILDRDRNGSGAGLSGHSGMNSPEEMQQAKSMQDSGNQKATIAQVCQTLNGIVDKVNQFYDKLLAEHKEEIAKLSIEIARKILVQKVEKGDYEIDSIVKEALKNSPTREDIVVHLNPDDLVQCQKVQQDDPNSTLAGVRLVADPNIGRAECLLETPKGIVESFINEQIARIGEALKNSQTQ